MLSEFTPGEAPRAGLWEAIAAALRRAIITGDLAAGEHLQEPVVAAKFGTSRVPVREALIRLEHEGLVRNEPRRGAFVVGMTLDDVREIYDMRRLHEAHACRLAAARATPADAARLDSLIARMERGLQRGNFDLVAEMDIGFHREVIVAAAHRRLLACWEPLSGVITTLLALSDAASRDNSIIASHRAIAHALAAHDAGSAEAELLAHLQRAEQALADSWSQLVAHSPIRRARS